MRSELEGAVLNRRGSEEVKCVAFDAYQYLYPMVIMEITRRQATNVDDADTVPSRAPLNQFAHYRTYPKGEARDVVRFNFDTLYSFAWLDLSQGPIVLTVPHSPDRYHLTPILDMWTDVFAVPGTRTTGGVGGNYALIPPGWDGQLPDGVEPLPAPTPAVWVMGRIQTNGPSDYEAVHQVQDQYRATPLSRWGTEFTSAAGYVDPAVDDTTDPLAQINALDAEAFFTEAARLLAIHPPHLNDQPILARMRTIGIVPGKLFDIEALGEDGKKALADGAAEALTDLVASTTDGSLGTWHGPWMTIRGGTYGTDYRSRAMVALAGLGCNLPEDALYPGTALDATGQLLTGENRYALHFGPGELPPADAFWSLTMYDAEGFQVPNDIDRFAIGDRDSLTFNDDGSLDIHIQHDTPDAERKSNWLPAPAAGPFQPMLRIYSPRADVLRHGLNLPAITRVD